MQPQRNAVGWFELYVDDMARAKAFYSAVIQRDMVARCWRPSFRSVNTAFRL